MSYAKGKQVSPVCGTTKAAHVRGRFSKSTALVATLILSGEASGLPHCRQIGHEKRNLTWNFVGFHFADDANAKGIFPTETAASIPCAWLAMDSGSPVSCTHGGPRNKHIKRMYLQIDQKSRQWYTIAKLYGRAQPWKEEFVNLYHPLDATVL